MPGQARVLPGDKRVFITDQDSDVTTSVAGSNGFETIWDLSPSTDISYVFPEEDSPQLGSLGNLRIRFQFPQDGGGSTEISDDARVKFIAQKPNEEEGPTDVIGRIYRYGEFSNSDQYDNDNVIRLTPEETALITEASHFKIQVDNSTAGNDVDLSQTGGQADVETFRRVA